MKRKATGILMILAGVLTVFGGLAAEIAWLIFCFGSVIIGVLLLIFAPVVLTAPFYFFSTIGGGLILKGVENFKLVGLPAEG